MNELVWLVLTFIVVVGVSFLGLERISRRGRRLEDRVSERDEADSNPELILGPSLTTALGQAAGTERRMALEQELRGAGYYQRTALMEYVAVRAAMVILTLILTGLVALAVPEPQIPLVVWFGVMAAVMVFALPRLYIGYRRQLRTAEIERGLPVAVDLLTLGLTGGQHIFAALQRVSDELETSYPALSQELRFMKHQAELGSLQFALQQFADRVKISEVQNLTLILVQSERLGTDTSTSLLEFSNNYRMNLRQRAEAQANRASFWMLFPSILCLWLPAAMMIVAPIYFEFFYRRSQAREILEQGAQPRQVGAANPGTVPGLSDADSAALP